MTNITAPEATAMTRTTSLRCEGTKTSSSAVRSGITIRARRACPCSTLTSNREADDGDHGDAEDHGQGVVRELAGLRELEQEAEAARDLAGAVDARVVDDGTVD